MSHELRQPLEGEPMRGASRAVREASFEGFKPRQLQAADQFGIGDRRRVQQAVAVERRGIHGSTVPSTGVPTEVKTLESQGHPVFQTLESVGAKALILEGMRMAGLNHGQMCAYIGNRKGGPYDQSQWTKALDSGDLPWGRMLERLPVAFWRPVLARLMRSAGMTVSNADIASISMQRLAMAFHMVAEAFSESQQQKAG